MMYLEPSAELSQFERNSGSKDLCFCQRKSAAWDKPMRQQHAQHLSSSNRISATSLHGGNPLVLHASKSIQKLCICSLTSHLQASTRWFDQLVLQPEYRMARMFGK
mmetsp:Transcript_21269/g.50762  ORF Transcript_21269/g.50762 Transcript_21269/m.50762 type:complete len:106 (+) Transcript_21269:189-506(+)